MDHLVLSVFEKLQARGWMIATAESCTGGMIAQMLTAVAGSSAFVDRGFVTYSNQAKIEMLAVPPLMIEQYGAVSSSVAEAMAQGALQNSKAGIAVSVTGIAGPAGGSDEKPVGLVHIGVASWDDVRTYKHIFQGGRDAVRTQAAEAALNHLLEFMA